MIPIACTYRPRPTGDHERVGICLIIISAWFYDQQRLSHAIKYRR